MAATRLCTHTSLHTRLCTLHGSHLHGTEEHTAVCPLCLRSCCLPLHASACACIHICIYTHAHVHAHAHAYARAFLLACADTGCCGCAASTKPSASNSQHTRACKNRKRKHTQKHARAHAKTRTCKQTHTHAHTCAHTHASRKPRRILVVQQVDDVAPRALHLFCAHEICVRAAVSVVQPHQPHHVAASLRARGARGFVCLRCTRACVHAVHAHMSSMHLCREVVCVCVCVCVLWGSGWTGVLSCAHVLLHLCREVECVYALRRRTRTCVLSCARA